MKLINYITLTLSLLLLCNCTKEHEHFDNALYIQTDQTLDETLLKGKTTEITKQILVRVPQPTDRDLKVGIGVQSEKVTVYNRIYAQDAQILDSKHYALSTTEASIQQGGVQSLPIQISFTHLGDLDRDKIYVLPVGITKSDIPQIETRSTVYYVFKAGALINIVADVEGNYLSVNWKDKDVVNDLESFTMEALINARNYDRLISTVMGCEGYFLIRIGDAGYPPNQIQIVTPEGNFPAPDSKKGLPTNQWIHIALTHDSDSGETILYVNGEKQGQKTLSAPDLISFASSDHDPFYIGKSYDDARFLAGNISECRIWKVVRTQEEIANNPYGVDPATPGLVAYWKFDEQGASTIADATGHGNNAIPAKPLSWTKVNLPEPK